jgi:hypothetical protein
MLAAHDRVLPADSAAADAPSATTAPPTVEPDLDALAHQVYSVLRRRLSIERRRHG